MAKFSRIEVVEKMKKTGLIPLFYDEDLEICKKIVMVCFRGGARVFEFTARGDFAHEIFAELNKYVINELPSLALGVGSITDAGAASLYMNLGANFIVTPVLREDIAIVCNRKKVLWSPGCGSLTEISNAEELGCEIVKLFPGALYGPEFVKAIKGPQPWTSIMPTGGVQPTAEDIKDWFESGVHCIGIGSKIFIKKDDGSYDYTAIREILENTIKIIAKYKKTL